MASVGERLFTGARGYLYCRGKQIAHFTGASGTRRFETAQYKPCGSDRTAATVLMGQDIDFTIDRVGFEDEDAYTLALMPGGEEGDLIDWTEMKAVIIDRKTDKPWREIDGLMPASEGFNFQARSLCQENLSFTGRIWKHGGEIK